MMNLTSKFIAVGAGCLGLSAVLSPLASATDLLNDPADSITASDPTQMGRISRNGVQQTWDPVTSGEATYPGVNPTTTGTTFNYTTYTFTPAQIGNGQYVEINFEEPNAGADLFVSAWTTYAGTSSVNTPAGAPLGTNGFLGDEGGSGDYAFGSIPPTPQDPRFFNVTVPKGADLVVVVNTTAATALGETYGIDIEDFSTKQYADATPTAVPEPSSWVMLGASGLVLGVVVSRRRSATV